MKHPDASGKALLLLMQAQVYMAIESFQAECLDLSTA